MANLRSITRRARRFCRKGDGAMAVEFAFVAPVMLTMIFGIIEFGRIAYTQSTLEFAAEETTRFAVVRGGDVTNEEVLNFARSRLLALENELAVVCLRTPTDATTQTSTISIAIDYDYDLMLPLPISDFSLRGQSEGYISFSPLDAENDLAGDCEETTTDVEDQGQTDGGASVGDL